jgi:hypothetical protein
LAEAWGVLKRVHVKKIVAWTQNGHKAKDGDHLARVSLKQEEGLGRLVSNFGPGNGVPGCKHPGVGGQEEDEEDKSDEDGSDSKSGSGSESSGGGASESETPGGGNEQTNSKDPAGKERSGLETKEKGEGVGSATESRKRRGAINGADEPPAQKPKLNTRGGKGGIKSPDGEPPRLFKPGGMAKYYRELEQRPAKTAKLEKGN